MKKKYKYKKELQQALTELGIKDVAISDQGSQSLINPQRRVLKAILEQPEDKQLETLNTFKSQIAEIKKKREEDNKILETH